jgi:hypothetical protein
MKNFTINTLLLGTAVALAACSFVSLNPQAQNTTVSTNTNALSNCKFMVILMFLCGQKQEPSKVNLHQKVN